MPPGATDADHVPSEPVRTDVGPLESTTSTLTPVMGAPSVSVTVPDTSAVAGLSRTSSPPHTRVCPSPMTMESTVLSRYPSAVTASVHVPSEGALTSNEPSEPVVPDTDEEPSDSVTVASATGVPSVERTVPDTWRSDALALSTALSAALRSATRPSYHVW